jgi:YesN/AraC family two-component response regulator
MSKLLFSDLPKIYFAHTYSAPVYKNQISADTNVIELSYVASGALTLCSQAGEQQAKQGDILCFVHDEPIFVYSNVPHEHHTVCFTIPFTTVAQGGKNFPLITLGCPSTKRVERIIDDIIRIFSTDSYRTMFLTSLIFETLDILSETRARMEPEENSYGNIRYVEKAKHFIYDNLHRDIRQKEVAEYLGISPQYLCSILKKIEGISIINFINRMKMEKINSLMMKENLKLYEAASLFGYSDPNYVSKLYKKFFHVNITQH